MNKLQISALALCLTSYPAHTHAADTDDGETAPTHRMVINDSSLGALSPPLVTTAASAIGTSLADLMITEDTGATSAPVERKRKRIDDIANDDDDDNLSAESSSSSVSGDEADDDSSEDESAARTIAERYTAFIPGLVKRRAPLKEIYSFCRSRGANWVYRLNATERKRRLNVIFAVFYAKGELRSRDTMYLKEENVVIDRRGRTKERIRRFLEIRSAGFPTETLKDLIAAFNVSRFRAQRPITASTFYAHVRGMGFGDFLSRCKAR